MVSLQIAALLLTVSGVGDTVLLDFNAPWCGPCRQMDGTISQLEAAGYPVRRVNIDQEPGLAKRYGVENIPCFVMVADGREIGRSVGATSLGQLKAMYAKAGAHGPQGGADLARGQSPDPPLRRRLLPSRGGAGSTPALPAAMSSAPLAADPFAMNNAATRPATTAAAASDPSQGGPSASQLIEMNVRLKIEDKAGFSYGSGTLVDTRAGEALILTCGHIFRDSQGQGKISVDLFGPQAPKGVVGQLISYDLKRDVGLVSIRPNCPVTVARIAPKGYQLNKGDKVVSVGCNNGGEPTAIESHVTTVDKFLGPANVQVAGQPVQGRSGGGLFTAEGLVIGVCNAADPAENEGLFAAPATIQAQLDDAKLSAIYQSRGPRGVAAPLDADPTNGNSDVAAAPPSMPQRMPVSKTQDSVLTAAQGPNNGNRNAGNGSLGSPGALNADEAAALSALSGKADGAEVICIVRNAADPQGKSQVIVLDRASSRFLEQLAAERQTQPGRQLTSLEVPRTANRSAASGPAAAGDLRRLQR